jgi:hypothetical protein
MPISFTTPAAYELQEIRARDPKAWVQISCDSHNSCNSHGSAG